LLTDLPGLRFTIAGSEAAAFAEAAGLRHQYHIVNNPKYISDLYKKARLMVAPTRFAAGIPMKVHEAASHGVPVVMTELLADQLGWRRYGAGVSTTPPEQMAHSIRHLALNQEAWQRCQSLQLDLIRQDCDPARFSETIRQAITV
jgi:glycosyltransferase involved in cell wall biosynthesis